jgi:hypothetical protein
VHLTVGDSSSFLLIFNQKTVAIKNIQTIIELNPRLKKYGLIKTAVGIFIVVADWPT